MYTLNELRAVEHDAGLVRRFSVQAVDVKQLAEPAVTGEVFVVTHYDYADGRYIEISYHGSAWLALVRYHHIVRALED